MSKKEEMAESALAEECRVAENSAMVEAASDETRHRILIFNQEGSSDGMDDVFVGVNGKAYQIKREQEVVVPASVLHVLDNAMIGVVSRDGKESIRQARRFNYSNLGQA